MHLALLTDGLYPYLIGGMQRHSFYLTKYLAQNQVQVDLYHTNKSDYDVSKLEFFSNEERKYIRSFVIDFPDLGKMPGHYIRESYEYSRRIFELFRKNSKVDFVYIKGFSGWKLLEEKKRGLQLPPIGINFHGYEMFQKAPSFKSMIEQKVFFRSPVMFNVSHSDYVFSYGGKITGIIKGLGVHPGKIIEVPAGIEASWLRSEAKPVLARRKFIFIGRYERRKGIEELNSALRILKDKMDFEFTFIGPVPESKRVVSEKIHYVGMISDARELKTILRSTDVLVCPSHSEGMPNVILEAMASGLSVIATDVGAVSLLVRPDNGWLTPACSVADIEKAMAAAIGLGQDQLAGMQARASAHIRMNFLWDDIAKKLIHALRDITNAGAPD